MIKCRKRKWTWIRIVVFTVIIVFGYLALYIHSFTAGDVELPSDNADASLDLLNHDTLKRWFPEDTIVDGVKRSLQEDEIVGQPGNGFLVRKLLADTTNTTSKQSEYPPDLFTLEQRRKGAIVLHVLGMIYMFLALAIVCDEYFIPALQVIIEVFQISEDVAGATFMAAGGSAPELFTSFIGLFAAKNNVGIGTIVGSAVFNILFVIAMCTLVSKHLLKLTWWPLFRDLTFYSIHLMFLIGFYTDELIHWYESTVLLLLYLLYVIFMKFNDSISRFVKHILYRRCSKVNAHRSSTLSGTMDRLKNKDCTIKLGKQYRTGLVELLIHAIDPLSSDIVEVKIERVQAIGSGLLYHDIVEVKAERVHAIGQGLVSPSNSTTVTSFNTCDNNTLQYPSVITAVEDDLFTPTPLNNHNVYAMTNDPHVYSTVITNLDDVNQLNTSTVEADPPHETNGGTNISSVTNGVLPLANGHNHTHNQYSQYTYTSHNVSKHSITNSSPTSLDSSHSTLNTNNNANKTRTESSDAAPTEPSPNDPQDEDDKPLDLSWPSGFWKRFMYVIVAPIIFPLWVTLPDVRRPERRKLFAITFLGSILWIGGFSYLMVWWANQTGETIGIPIEVMGLTILAAGTSIPDLITSVIVAKKGFGDMAVSSSVGSNIFDITVGLPLPWICYTIAYNEPVSVKSDGLFCSIVLLFIVLIILLIGVIVSRWQLHKFFGLFILVLYIGYLTCALLVQYKVVKCPI